MRMMFLQENNLFYQRMIVFVDILDLNYQKHQTHGTVIYEKYRGKFLFTMEKFVSFVTDRQ